MPEKEPQAQYHRDYGRAGDIKKCPACGVSMDPEAYRCPKCRIYFCVKCRRRVQPRDEQFQCMNQQCGYYGKLLCNACVVEIPQMGDRTRQELCEVEKPLVNVPRMVVAVVLPCVIPAAVIFYFNNYSDFIQGFWWFGLVVSMIPAIVVAIPLFLLLFRRAIKRKEAVYKSVTENVELGRRKCCIACRQAVEHLV